MRLGRALDWCIAAFYFYDDTQLVLSTQSPLNEMLFMPNNDATTFKHYEYMEHGSLHESC